MKNKRISSGIAVFAVVVIIAVVVGIIFYQNSDPVKFKNS